MSNPLLERRLKEFVDRDQEMAAFMALLESAEKHIMYVWGESGIGKSSLLMRMIHECSVRKLARAEVVWKDTEPHNHLAVMRKIRDDVGLEQFRAFTDLVNFYHEAGYQPKLEVTLAVQGAVSVAQGMQNSGSSVGDIAAVLIKDCNITIPRVDLSVPESERRSRLTQRFIEDLKAVVAKQPLVVFFDAVEKMSADTEKWVWEGLMDAVRNGVLANIKFVQCGQKPPPGDRDWLFLITSAGLKPLGGRDIAAYLAKRVPGVDDAVVKELTALILGVTSGKPANVASTVDAFLQMRSSQAHGG